MASDISGKTTFHLTVSPENARRLEEIASEAGVEPEEVLRTSVEEWLARPRADFAEAAAYVLKKNSDLYRRLS
jgi:predicted transcriptional regulator